MHICWGFPAPWLAYPCYGCKQAVGTHKWAQTSSVAQAQGLHSRLNDCPSPAVCRLRYFWLSCFFPSDTETTLCSAARDPRLPRSRVPRNFDDAGLEIAASVATKGFTYGESQSQVNSKDEQRAGLKYCWSWASGFVGPTKTCPAAAIGAEEEFCWDESWLSVHLVWTLPLSFVFQ